jgi:hypothetical protein
MQGINNPSRLAPRNPTAKELNLLMEGKHRELRGFLCCENDHKIIGNFMNKIQERIDDCEK